MFKRLSDLHRLMDEDAILVLDNPARIDQVPPGWRRHLAANLALLTPIERRQFRDFMVKYRGLKFYIAAAKLVLPFSLVGVALHLLFPDHLGWGQALLLANVFGYGMAFGVLGIWFSYRYKDRKKPSGSRIFRVALFSLIGFLLASILTSLGDGQPLEQHMETMGRVLAWGLVVSGLGFGVPIAIAIVWRNRQFEALTLQLHLEAERERMARELSESQLRLLRAQIEPHFLFNTLGAVQQLAEREAPRAAELTANLIAFLRASLDEMRVEQVSLDKEFRLVKAYLEVMQVRLGPRLSFALELPPQLTALEVPSMILLTLVENAIKHGIEPALRGGKITVSAQENGAMLQLRVHDTGVGLAVGLPDAAAPSGLGLDNVRGRLRLADARASLALYDADQGGAIADIALPLPNHP